MKTAEKYLLLITKPSRFFASVLLEQKVGWALFFLFVLSSLFCLIRAALDGALGLPSTASTLGQFVITVTVVACGYCALYGLASLALGKKLGGKGTFKRLFLVAAYSLLPTILFAAPPTALMGLIWSFCLAVIGLRIAHGFPLGRAITVQAIMVALTAMLAGVLAFGLMKAMQRHYPAEKLVHQPAPSAVLAPFDGEPFELSSFKGKSVVVLDFWATWCSPCRSSLPTLAEIAREYKAQNVVVLAVSNDDDWHTAKSYLEAAKVDLVGIKGTAELNKDFMVEALPETVIVDKNGNVAWAHVGVPLNEKEALRAELDRCLSQSR
ncbi:MAG: redoxin family protein [Candidatus Obscuribacterales bacterium]